jgi:hypothetical protein
MSHVPYSPMVGTLMFAMVVVDHMCTNKVNWDSVK